MKRKKSLIVLVCLALLTGTILSGCSACGQTKQIQKSSQETESTETQVRERTPDALAYCWDPYLFNEYWAEVYGELARDDYHNVVDAIVNQEELCYCSADFEANLEYILKSSFPPASGLFTYTYGEDGYLHFNFKKTKEEQDAIFETYGEEMEDLIEGFTYEGDSQAMIAVEMYFRYTEGDVYTFTHILNQCGIPAYAKASKKQKYVVMELDGVKYKVIPVDGNADVSMKNFALPLDGSEDTESSFAQLHQVTSAATLDRNGKELYVIGYDDEMNQIEVKVE